MTRAFDYDEFAPKNRYWEQRKFDLYYVAIARYVQVIAFDAVNVIDVGSSSTQLLEWFPWIPNRVALDLHQPEAPPFIETIKADFLTWQPDRRYDVALCCQVLEHIDEPAPFASKLLEIADKVLVSVPYKWLGNTPGHVQDPVDEEKFLSWFDVKPNYLQIVSEPFGPQRMFGYFDVAKGPAFRFEQQFLREARRTRPVSLP